MAGFFSNIIDKLRGRPPVHKGPIAFEEQENAMEGYLSAIKKAVEIGGKRLSETQRNQLIDRMTEKLPEYYNRIPSEDQSMFKDAVLSSFSRHDNIHPDIQAAAQAIGTKIARQPILAPSKKSYQSSESAAIDPMAGLTHAMNYTAPEIFTKLLPPDQNKVIQDSLNYLHTLSQLSKEGNDTMLEEGKDAVKKQFIEELKALPLSKEQTVELHKQAKELFGANNEITQILKPKEPERLTTAIMKTASEAIQKASLDPLKLTPKEELAQLALKERYLDKAEQELDKRMKNIKTPSVSSTSLDKEYQKLQQEEEALKKEEEKLQKEEKTLHTPSSKHADSQDMDTIDAEIKALDQQLAKLGKQLKKSGVTDVETPGNTPTRSHTERAQQSKASTQVGGPS